MKTIMLINFFLFSLLTVYSQSIERSVIGNGGEDITNNTQYFNQTFGQAVTNILSEGIELSQGFQNPIEGFGTTSVSELNEIPRTKIFPNPSSGVFAFWVDQKNLTHLTAQIYDTQGKRILAQRLSDLEGKGAYYKIDMGPNLMEGMYLLTIQDNHKIISNQKIIILK